MMKFKHIALAGLLMLALAGFTFAQTGGSYDASSFAYGYQGNAPIRIYTGNTATGSQIITLAYGSVTMKSGLKIAPITTTTPITIGVGSTAETKTPSAVSCTTPDVYGSCTVTVSFTYVHGRNEQIMSGSYGLQEAINYAVAQGGGKVLLSQAWAKLGGTDTLVAAAIGNSQAPIVDNRASIPTYWSLQPTTLTSLAAPATLDATSATWTGTTGTWTNAAHYLCVTYVDALGGEGPCSATYNVTPDASTILHIASPAASTGAVGWRAYAGASYNGAYLLPVSSTSCTLTTLESVMPACAIGSAGTWTAIFANTTTLRPNAQSPTVNLILPYPQGHTTFAYKPSGLVPYSFQTHHGPFPAFGSTTSGQVDVIGSVNLPTGYLNYIGRTVKISGKFTATVNTAAVPSLTISLGWVAGTTAGAPVAVCTMVGAAYGSSAAFNGNFECTMTTNATGASAATIMTNGTLRYATAAGGAAGVSFLDTGAAAIGSLGISQQNTVYVSYTSGTNTTTAVQLLSLDVETLQ